MSEEEPEKQTFTLVPTRVVNERTYVCDLLEPHEIQTTNITVEQPSSYDECYNTNCATTTTTTYTINDVNACVSKNNTYNAPNNNNNYNYKYNYTYTPSAEQSERTLFHVEPDILLFPPPHHGRCIQNVLMLHNGSESEMCVYKLKCEKLHAFVAKHNVGVMYANSSLELRVTLRAVDRESEAHDADRKSKDYEEAGDDHNNRNNSSVNNVSSKEINEHTVVHFRIEIKYFTELPERFTSHLHFKKLKQSHKSEHDSAHGNHNSKKEEEEENSRNDEDEEEEDDIEDNKILNERVNAREVWNYFAELDPHNHHHRNHHEEEYYEQHESNNDKDDVQKEKNESEESTHSHRHAITQCEIIDIKAFFDKFTKRPETSTIIELPADYPDGLHSYVRSEHNHSKPASHTAEHKEKDEKQDHINNNDESKNKDAEKQSTEQKSPTLGLTAAAAENESKQSNTNKESTTTNTNVNEKEKTINNMIDTDMPDKMRENTLTSSSSSPSAKSSNATKTLKNEEDAKNALPTSTQTNATEKTNIDDNNNNNNKDQGKNELESKTNAGKDDNVSFHNKILPQSSEMPQAAKSANAAATEAKPPTAAAEGAPTEDIKAATDSLIELYPNDDNPTRRGEPTDTFNDTTDAIKENKEASERAKALDQQKHVSFANYSTSLLQAPLSIDNLAASIRASTLYNKSMVLKNRMRPYANMLLICIGLICVLALLLPPPTGGATAATTTGKA